MPNKLSRVMGVAVCSLLSPSLVAPADARVPGERRVEAVVKKRIVRVVRVAPKVTCAAVGRARPAKRWICRWSGRRRLDAGLMRACRGRYRVRLTGRPSSEWQLRSLARRCLEHSSSAPGTLLLPEEPTPSAPSAAPPIRFGFNDNAVRAGWVSAETDAELTARAGADLHRVTFDWRWAEPYRGDYRLAEYDAIYQAMLARGIRPVFILLFSPWWSWEQPAQCDQWGEECRFPPARAEDAEWREIAGIVAERYPEAAAIEIWNEPNYPGFWHSGPDPARYTELLASAHEAIKSHNPSMTVVGGALSGHDRTADGVISSAAFTRAIYDQGAARSMDALSFHPYMDRPDPAIIAAKVDALRAVRDSFGDHDKPLWITETGLTTSGPDAVTEQQQADALGATYRLLAGMADVDAVMVHSLIEPDRDASDPETGFGVLRRDLSAKPAFCALAALRGRADACGA